MTIMNAIFIKIFFNLFSISAVITLFLFCGFVFFPLHWILENDNYYIKDSF